MESNNESITIIDITSGEKITTFKPDDSLENIIALSADGSITVTSRNTISSNFALTLWNTKSGEKVRTIPAHADGITACTISKDNSRIITASHDNYIKVWDAESGKNLKKIAAPLESIRNIAFFQDNTMAVSATRYGTVQVWNLEKEQLVYSFYSPDQSDTYIAWTPENYLSGDEALINELVYIVDNGKIINISDYYSTLYQPGIIEAKMSGKDISSYPDYTDITNLIK